MAMESTTKSNNAVIDYIKENGIWDNLPVSDKVDANGKQIIGW